MYLEGKQKTAVTSFKILETGNYDIGLIENYLYIETLDCVNKVITKGI